MKLLDAKLTESVSEPQDVASIKDLVRCILDEARLVLPGIQSKLLLSVAVCIYTPSLRGIEP